LFPLYDTAYNRCPSVVVPDGRAAFREAWRVPTPGGRAVVLDKFLPEDGRLTFGRPLVGWTASTSGTDRNHRLSEIVGGLPSLEIVRNEPSLLRGQYRIVKLRKG
jgi:hypothetical protein